MSQNSTNPKNWEIWQMIEADVTRAVRRWQGGDPDRTHDIVAAGMVRWVVSHDPETYPHPRQATTRALQACRAAVRDEGLDYRRVIPTDPADLPEAADCATPESLMAAAEEALGHRRQAAAAMRLAELLRPDLHRAVHLAGVCGQSMAHACMTAGVRQAELSRALRGIGELVTGRPVIRQRRRDRAAQAGQLALSWA